MADEQTEAEWAKSKRIEAERMKAARAMADEKIDKTNLAFLDPKSTKVKGWSNDPDVVLADGEKMGNRALIFAISGLVLSSIGAIGGIVSSTFNLGLAGAVLAIPSGISLVCIWAAVLMALVAIACEIYLKVKKARKFSVAFWSSICTIVLIIIYYAIRWLVFRFG